VQQEPKSQRKRAAALISLLVPTWRPTPRQGLWAGGIAAFLTVLTVSVVIGYRYDITLWDWIKLLIVPAVIAGAGFWFNTQQREREQRIADNRAQDDSLQAYLDGMSQLLIDKDQPLHSAKPGDSLSTVARARTLTVLGRLDGGRKRSVLQFLYESGLIYKEQTLLSESDLIKRRLNIVSLQQADLSGAHLNRIQLEGADLSRADLSGAYLRALLWEADLSMANLSGANLSRAILSYANLSYANLSHANLSHADLSYANLSYANLSYANLSHADLSGTDLSGGPILSGADLFGASGITNKKIEQVARRLEGATMRNGQKYEDWLKDKKAQGKDEKNE
jgi:Pentapeptide repeats (8 copies)